MKGELGPGRSSFRRGGAGIAWDLFVWSGGGEGVRGAERRGGCIAWGIGRKGREGGAGAGSQECGRGCEGCGGRCGETRGSMRESGEMWESGEGRGRSGGRCEGCGGGSEGCGGGCEGAI